MNNMFLVKGFLSSKGTKFYPGTESKKAVLISQVGVATGAKDSAGKKTYNWFAVKAFGQTAELINQYVAPGSYVELEGFMAMNAEYTDTQGVKHYPSMYLCATNFLSLDRQSQVQTQTAEQPANPNMLQEAVL